MRNPSSCQRSRLRRSMRIAVVCVVLTWTFGTLSTGELNASTPRLSRILPRGVERGQLQVLTFHGDRLGDAEEIFFYDDGIRVTSLTVIDAKRVEATVNVDVDCRLGEHVAQVRTRTGISDYRIVQVEAYAATDETEPNNDSNTAVAVVPKPYSKALPKAIGVVVAGVLKDEDHDWFAVEGTQGDRLSIEVVGMRLGDYCDAALELLGPDGTVLARVDDTPLTKQDPYLSLQLPADGRYLIHLSDASGRGGNTCYYRLHVGNFPRPAMAVPAVAREGETAEVTFLGDGYGEIQRTLTLSQDDLYQNGLLVSDQRGVTPTPVPFWLSDATVVAEQEPNDNRKLAGPPHELPFSAYGFVEAEKARDTFAFNATKGQRIRLDVLGHRMGSPIDTTLRLQRPDGRRVGANSDSQGVDSRFGYTIPADGTYFVNLSDALNRYGPEFRYQLSVIEVTPSVEVSIKQFERYSQLRQTVALHHGNRFAAVFNFAGENIDDPLELVTNQLPAGWRMHARSVPPGVTELPVVFESIAETPAVAEETAIAARPVSLNELADQKEEVETPSKETAVGSTGDPDDESVPTFGRLIDLRAQPVAAKSVTIGHFSNRAQLMRVQPNNMTFHSGVVDRLAVALLDPAPFYIELEPPQVPLAQNGRQSLVVNIRREEGFDKPITLRLPYRSRGVNARGSLVVKPNQNTVKYPISANEKASVGKWPICLTATAPNNGDVLISTGLHELEVIERCVDLTGGLVMCRAGEEVAVEVPVEVLEPFEGTAQVKLVGLPPHATAESKPLTADYQQISFQVKTAPKCPVGNHQAVACEVTLQQNGHPITFRTGKITLKVSAPVKPAGDKAEAKK